MPGLEFDLKHELNSVGYLSETCRIEIENLSLKALRSLAQSLAHSLAPDDVRYLIKLEQNPQAKKLGCWLLVKTDKLPLRDGLGLARHLALDEDWGVREEVTYLYRRLMIEHLPEESNEFEREMSIGPSRVKRAIAIGAGRVPTHGIAKKRPGLGPVLLGILEHALADPDPYLVKNLGPFAIGSYLLGYFPCTVFPAIERWAGSPDERVRATAARSLTAEGSSKDPARATTLALRFLQDDSNIVSRVARRAVGRLVKKHRAEAMATILDWSRQSPDREQLAAEWL